MDKIKHTPGPWRVSGGRHALGDPAMPRMWWLRDGAVSLGTDNEADAHLCSAAPELYAAVQKALEYHRALEKCVNDPNAMASFCTAKGETLDDLYADWLAASVAASMKARGEFK